MSRVLFRWAGQSLYAYSALVGLGTVLAVVYACWQGQRKGLAYAGVLDAALWCLAGGFLGGRLAYVMTHLRDLEAGLMPAVLTRGGGLVFQGGLLGSALSLYVHSRRTGACFPRLADIGAPAVALAQALGWAGAHLHGANYGLLVQPPFSMWLPDIFGVYGPRVPVQLMAFFFGLLLFRWLHGLGPWRQPPGVLALLYLAVGGSGHFLLEFARADEALHGGMLRVTQVGELVTAGIAVALLSRLWVRRRASVQPGRRHPA
jgi:phosphatidylglycerol:prolipoprotein diacylglycerol transferase